MVGSNEKQKKEEIKLKERKRRKEGQKEKIMAREIHGDRKQERK